MSRLPCVPGPVLRISKEVKTLKDEKDQGTLALLTLVQMMLQLFVGIVSLLIRRWNALRPYGAGQRLHCDSHPVI